MTFAIAAVTIASVELRDRATARARPAPLVNVTAAIGDAFPRPALSDPIRITLHRGEDHLRLDDSRDYILVPPDEMKTGVLEIRGGRNVVMIGGFLSVSEPGPNVIISDGRSAKDGRVVHLEGILINSASGAQSDGIRIRAPNAIVQVVRSRIVRLLGSKSGIHADVIQPFGGMKELRIDGLTAGSHYNNLYLRRENDPLGPPIGKVTVYNANIVGYWNGSRASPEETLRAISIGTQTVDPDNTTSSVNCALTAPVVLRNVYMKPARKRPGQFLYPHDGMKAAGCPAKVSADGLTVGWPALSLVSGRMNIGAPPAGDFVPATEAGLSYRG